MSSQQTETKSILLLHRHLTPTPAHQPLLQAIQKVLNESYRKSHSARADIFGTSFTRLPDPAHFANSIGGYGFTIALCRAPNKDEHLDIMATGSARRFKHPEAETYEQWMTALSAGTADSADLDGGEVATGDIDDTESVSTLKYEVTAFAVSPDAQARGLGARVLRELEWLVKRIPSRGNLRQWLGDTMPTVAVEGALLGFDLDKILSQHNDIAQQAGSAPQLVLFGIQELGTEAYYQRRGFHTVWTGAVPAGTWYSLNECTAVYMEKTM